VRRYRKDRAARLDVEAALEDGLAVIFPRKVARLVALEPQTFVVLFRWLFRRRPYTAEEFGYNKRSPIGVLLIVLLMTAPVELLLIELFVPWEVVRWVLLILAVYSLLWLLAFNGSLRVLPHRLGAEGVRLRYGLLATGVVPYDQIASVTLEMRTGSDVKEGLQVVAEHTASIAVGGRTDVTLLLSEPVRFRTLLAETAPVSTVHVAVDKPEDFVRELRLRTGVEEGAEDGTIPAVAGGSTTPLEVFR
jgi:hypothetical protein